MEFSFQKLFLIILIVIGLFGLSGFFSPQKLRHKKRMRSLSERMMDTETKHIKQELRKQAKKRDQKIDKIGNLAKNKPADFASTMKKWFE